MLSGDAIDYWGDGPTLRRKTSRMKESDETHAPSVPETRTSLWAEPTRMSDGRTAIYVPPKAVLEFLDNPTRENARAYVAWQEERMRRLKSASALLEELKAERKETKSERHAPRDGKDLEKRETDKTSREKAPSLSGELLYFKKKGCPYCDLEDREIAALSRQHPGLKVRTLFPEEMPELWKGYGISVVPSLVVVGRDGRKILVRGYTPAADVAQVLTEVNRDRK